MDWPGGLVVLGALAGFLLARNPGVFRRSFKRMAVLAVFTIPVLVVRFFTVREGRRLRLLFWDVYSGALDGTLDVFVRILCVSLISSIVFSFMKPLNGPGRFRGRHSAAEMFFTSIELYQRMLADLAASFRNRGREGFLKRLDGIYHEEKRRALRNPGSGGAKTRVSR